MSAPHVVALVGTDHHPFDRLLGWAAAHHEAGLGRWFVQSGHTHRTTSLPGADFLTSDELTAALVAADVVVCHGGPGLVMEAREAGHVPILVARDPARGEHVDDHQQRFARRAAARGWAHQACTEPELRAVITTLATGPGRTTRSAVAACAPERVTSRFGDLVDTLVRGDRK